MYIKIIRGNREVIHECDSVETVVGDTVKLIIVSSGDTLCEEVECAPENCIFFMNDFGKTIDRRVWR